ARAGPLRLGAVPVRLARTPVAPRRARAGRPRADGRVVGILSLDRSFPATLRHSHWRRMVHPVTIVENAAVCPRARPLSGRLLGRVRGVRTLGRALSPRLLAVLVRDGSLWRPPVERR